MELKTGQFFAACPPSSPILANRHPRALDAWPPLSGACATATRLPADFTSGLAGLEAVDAACQMLCRGQPFEAAWPYSSGVHYLAGGPTLPPSLRLKEDWEFAKTYGIIVKPTVGGEGGQGRCTADGGTGMHPRPPPWSTPRPRSMTFGFDYRN
ncbi:hypothetical protein BS50DRAFT_163330 [Corynespora cassiicola Philippines]|uniref:Uncharacterized protein n=1 Tax=Corynespora cassiicola Philippines TaxID=1448308 RepID=A0A2T2N6K7_CORCC|nr:hypothetical protein BS50DRAFT_163330 [Corynespora cassiicola Philippines]